MRMNLLILFLILGWCAQLNCNTAPVNTPVDPSAALADQAQKQLSSLTNLGDASDSDLMSLVKTKLPNHGFAILDFTRNQTEFPVDVFWNKTLTDLVPEGTTIRIKARYNGKYLAARNLMGAWRLRADATDANDPATVFVVHQHLNSDLASMITLEAQVAPGMYLRCKSNNEIILSKLTTIPALGKNQKSNDNFSSDFDIDSHWLLSSRNTKPDDAIDPNIGSYLDSCNLQSHYYMAYLSMRSMAEEQAVAIYQEPPMEWRWVQFAGNKKSVRYEDWGKKYYKDNDMDTPQYYQIYHAPLTAENMIPFEGNAGLNFLADAGYGTMPFIKLRGITPGKPPKVYNVANSGMPGQVALGSGIDWTSGISEHKPDWNRYHGSGGKKGYAFGYIKQGAFNFKDCAFNDVNTLSLEFALRVFNHARAYTYGETPKGGAYALNNWFNLTNTRIRPNIAKKKEPICYGDKIKLVANGSYLKLYSWDSTNNPKTGYVFGSHTDTKYEMEKYAKLIPAMTKDANIEDYSWWYVKGPHAPGDPWNCTIGKPVKDGDIIRLENVKTGRNLHYNLGQPPAKANLLWGTSAGSADSLGAQYTGGGKVTNSKKPLQHEMLINSFVQDPKINGVGDNNDNFILSIADTQDDNVWYKGTCVKLAPQNAQGFYLWSEHKFGDPGCGNSFGIIEALFPEEADQKATAKQWFVSASQGSSPPVADVAWLGVPNAAAQTSTSDRTELSLEIINVGVGNGIPPGGTLTTNIPLYGRTPKISGFASQTLPGFNNTQVANVSPLLNQGVAWLEQTIPTPDRTTLKFKANAKDSGDIQVLLGNKLTLDYFYKIVLGGGNNTQSYIVKKDVVGGVPTETKLAIVDKAQNPLAACVPGNYTAYWVGLSNGQIIVGVGEPADENVLMATADLSPRGQVVRLGFSTNQEAVSYSEVDICPEVEFDVPGKPYYNSATAVNIDPATNLIKRENNGELTLRVPGQGTVTFNLQGSGVAHLNFFDDPKLSSLNTPSAEQALRTKREQQQRLQQQINTLILNCGLTSFFQSSDNQLDALGNQNAASGVDANLQQTALAQKRVVTDFMANQTNYPLLNLWQGVSATAIPNDQLDLYHLVKDFNHSQGNAPSWQALSWGQLKSNLQNLVKLYINLTVSNPILLAHIDDLVSLIMGYTKLLDITRPNQGGIDVSTWLTIKPTTEGNANNATANNYRLTFQSPDALGKLLQGKTPAEVAKLQAAGQTALVRLEKSDPFAIESTHTALASSGEQKSSNLDISQPNGVDAWISFAKNKIMVGLGKEPGKNLLLYNWDAINPYQNLLKLGFISQGSVKLQNISLSGPIEVVKAEQSQDAYTQADNSFQYAGSLKIVAPYKYQMGQMGQQVKFQDLITQKIYFPGGVPQQGAMYHFNLNLQSDGFPQLTWNTLPTNELQVAISAAASLHTAMSTAWGSAAGYVQGGMGALSSMLGAVASATFAGLGVTEANKAAKLDITAQTAFRAQDSYVYTDQASAMQALAKQSVPPEAVANQAKVMTQLDLGAKFSPDATNFTNLVALYKDILGLITHPFVIHGQEARLYTALDQLYQTNDTFLQQANQTDPAQAAAQAQGGTPPPPDSSSSLLYLYLQAYNNPYLVDVSNNSQRKTKETWYSYANALAQNILNKNNGSTLVLPACYGEYVWLPTGLPLVGQGSIQFEAKGQNDLFICFASKPGKVRNSANDLYEINLGAWENSKTVIRIKSLGKAVAQTTNPAALLNNVKWQKYWISFNNGNIVLGTGEFIPQNAIGQYDPETEEFTSPEWTNSTQTLGLNPDWVKLAVGEKDFPGKDDILTLLSATGMQPNPTNLQSADIATLTNLLQARTQAINNLVAKQKYAYTLSGGSPGQYTVAPFGWQDPFYNPQSKIKYVGISCWDAQVQLRNIQIGGCIETGEFGNKCFIAQDNNLKNLPIFTDEPMADDARNKLDASGGNQVTKWLEANAKAIIAAQKADDAAARAASGVK